MGYEFWLSDLQRALNAFEKERGDLATRIVSVSGTFFGNINFHLKDGRVFQWSFIDDSIEVIGNWRE
jgi:hypothetical protein